MNDKDLLYLFGGAPRARPARGTKIEKKIESKDIAVIRKAQAKRDRKAAKK